MRSSTKILAVPTLSQILSEPEKVVALPREVIPGLRGELARIDTILLTRLLTDDDGSSANNQEDRLLEIAEAAAKLGLSHDALYRNDYPFVVKIGKRRRYSAKGIEKFIQARAKI